MSESRPENRLQALAADAARGIVDLSVSPDRSDRRFLNRIDPHRRYHMATDALARLGAGALGAGGTAIWMSLESGWSFDPSALTTLLSGGLAGIVLYRFGVERLWKSRIVRLSEQKKSFSDFRFRTDGAVMMIDDAVSHFRMALENIQRLVETPQRFAFIVNGTPIVVLPRAAFGEPAVAQAFIDFVRAKISTAHGAQRNEE